MKERSVVPDWTVDGLVASGRVGQVTHPSEWMAGEPRPVCGSPDTLECQLRIGADKVEMGWECSEPKATPHEVRASR
jgi:hypothetical protein